MLGLVLGAVVVVAVAAVGVRRFGRARLRRAARTRAGASPDLAIHVRSYADIDDHLAARWCAACGGYLERSGEGSRAAGDRRLRVARLACQECERVDEVFFDVTDVLH
jgi:hypothetical protein